MKYQNQPSNAFENQRRRQGKLFNINFVLSHFAAFQS